MPLAFLYTAVEHLDCSEEGDTSCVGCNTCVIKITICTICVMHIRLYYSLDNPNLVRG